MPHSCAPHADALLLDHLQLAWAAGFFDGEGSTYAYESRPGYLRLVVSVGQLGGTEPPEVLWRFKAAMLGLGEIEPLNDQGMWCWRARSSEEAQAAISLLWHELGAVKRLQAAIAVGRVHRQYGPGGLKHRTPRRRTSVGPHVVAVHGTPTAKESDTAWAAGFLDGEGHFGMPRSVGRKDGSSWRRIRVSASQHGETGKPAAVLLRLRQILGGRIEKHGDADDHRWVIESAPHVERTFMQVRVWLGTVKQAQASLVIAKFNAQTRRHGTATTCARGHAYDHVYATKRGQRNRCNACARIRSRMKRAQRGVAPRRFKNARRRYTF